MSHSQGGINVSFAGSPVQIEGDEYEQIKGYQLQPHTVKQNTWSFPLIRRSVFFTLSCSEIADLWTSLFGNVFQVEILTALARYTYNTRNFLFTNITEMKKHIKDNRTKHMILQYHIVMRPWHILWVAGIGGNIWVAGIGGNIYECYNYILSALCQTRSHQRSPPPLKCLPSPTPCQ